MKRITLASVIAGLLLVVFGGIVLHAPVIVLAQTHVPDLALAVKAWKEMIMLISATLLVVYVTRRQAWRLILSDWIIRCCMMYIIIHLAVAGLLGGEMTQVIAGLMIDLRYIAYSLLVYVFLRLVPGYRRLFVSVAAAGAAVVVGFACIQLLLPRDFLTHLGYGPQTIAPYMTVDRNYDYVRYASTLRGPNPLGAYAASVVVILLAWALMSWQRIDRSRIGWVLLGMAGLVGVWVSYARSAYLALVAGLAVVLGLCYGQRLRSRHWVAIALLIVASLAVIVLGRSNYHISNIIYHEDPGEGGLVNSNDEHLRSLVDGIGYALTHPLGAGIGRTGSASLESAQPLIIENQYLFITHEVGLIGVVTFGLLYGGILWQLYGQRREWLALGVLASGVGLAIVGLVLPVWADDTVSIIWWGLAAIALATKGGVDELTTEQKTA